MNEKARVCIGGMLLAGTIGAAWAQEFPQRPVRLVIPLAPGGGADVLVRAFSTRLGDRWGKAVIIDNRAGGDSTIGVNAVAKSAPDGYTLVLIYSIHAVHPSIKRNLPYDIVKDFAPVVNLAEAPSVVVANPGLPVSSIRELVALAKERPGKITFAGSGTGGSSHLAGELFNTYAGTRMLHVPYKGAGPALTDVIGGHVDLIFATMLAGMPHARSGKLRALAVTGKTRSSLLPNVPTIIESGLKDYEFATWYGLLAPAGTPRATLDKLHSDVAAVIRTSEVTQVYANQGAQVSGDGPDQFAAYLKTEIDKWARVAQEAKIPVEDIK